MKFRVLILTLLLLIISVTFCLTSWTAGKIFLSSSQELVAGSNINISSSNGTITISASSSSLPSGVIVMWSGLISNIPSGWQLCDGTNGTPDLRDRFIVGARQDDLGVAKTNVSGSLTQTGGEISHTHADHIFTQPSAHVYTPLGVVSQPLFTGNVLGTHQHGIGTYANTAISAGTPVGIISWPAEVPAFVGTAFTSVINHTHTVNIGSVNDTSTVSGAGNIFAGTTSSVVATTANPTGGVASITPAGTISWPGGVPTFSGSALGSHNHVFSGSSEQVSAGTPSGTVSQPNFTGTQANLGHTGGTVDSHSTASQLNPYYALAFIMKL